MGIEWVEWLENKNDSGITEQQEMFGGLHEIVVTSSL